MKGHTFLGRLLATHLAVAIAALAILGLTLDRVFEKRAVNDLRHRLVAEARMAQTAVARAGTTEGLVRALGRASGARLTVIRLDGTVLADSEHDAASMQNHANRPEIRAALAGGIGTAERTSPTLGRPFLYVALPESNRVIIRTALPSDRVAQQRDAVRRAMLIAFLASAALAAASSWLVARTVAGPMRNIAREVARVAHGEFAPIEPAGPKEARALARAVNHMATDLASRVEEIARETALREQILSAMQDAVILAEGTHVVYANPAARALFGITGDAPIPGSIPVPDGDAPTTRDVSLHHPAARDLRVAAIPLGGRRLLAVAQDVTEARRTDRVRRDFVANASHEMKTPVAAILATAETLETAANDDPEAAARFAGTLAREARRLSSLVRDLLDLARLEQPLASMSEVDLSELAEAIAEEARAGCLARGLTFAAEIDAGLSARGSEEDLALAIRNLLDNAIRYTPAGGTVELRLRTQDENVLVEVRDTGIGIPAKDLPRVFERFFRVDPARSRETGGTGLGLSIVRHVADAHGGSVSAGSELGAGSTFTLALPRA